MAGGERFDGREISNAGQTGDSGASESFHNEIHQDLFQAGKGDKANAADKTTASVDQAHEAADAAPTTADAGLEHQSRFEQNEAQKTPHEGLSDSMDRMTNAATRDGFQDHLDNDADDPKGLGHKQALLDTIEHHANQLRKAGLGDNVARAASAMYQSFISGGAGAGAREILVGKKE